MNSEKESALFRHHAKTFSLAARFFPPEIRDDVRVLYAFCRSLDDKVDLSASKDEAHRFLSTICGEIEGGTLKTFPRFQQLMVRKGVSSQVALQLVKTLQEDIDLLSIETEEELLDYCKGVASTVGMILCSIFSVAEKKALPHAIDLGIAMQMTNIVRDVYEDAERGKIYLPLEDFPAGFLSGNQEADCQKICQCFGTQPISVARVRLLSRAESYYASGMQGLRYLPFRIRFPVAAAAAMYREIGKASKKDLSCRRAVVPLSKKVFLSIKALGHTLFPPKGEPANERRFYSEMVDAYGRL